MLKFITGEVYLFCHFCVLATYETQIYTGFRMYPKDIAHLSQGRGGRKLIKAWHPE